MKNLASLGVVSTTNFQPILDKLFSCEMKKLVDDSSAPLHGEHKILLDGDWVGTCQDSESFVTKLRRMRRSNEIPQQVMKYFLEIDLVKAFL